MWVLLLMSIKKTLRERSKPSTGWVTKDPENIPDNRLLAEEVDDNFLALEEQIEGKEPAITKNTAFNKNFGTASDTVCQGNDSRLSDSRQASDVSSWAKESTLQAAAVPNLDASKITSGTLDLARIPHAALERLHVVDNQAARFALTTTNVQNGDTVKESDTGLMYFVVDQTNLGNASGYQVYSAGSATSAESVPWSGVTDKPSEFAPTTHGSDKHSDSYEPPLGNPTSDGYVLASTIDGIRSWIEQSGGEESAKVFIGTTTPVSPELGDLWWDSSAGSLFIYYNDGTSSQWVSTSSYGSGISFASNAEALSGVEEAKAMSPATTTHVLEQHTDLTTTAHGGIVADTDARLSDARTPLTHGSDKHSESYEPVISTKNTAFNKDFASTLQATTGTATDVVMSPATTHATVFQPATTLYVRPPAAGGSNSNNGTSWATPFATIQHAIDSLRKHLTGDVTIRVGAGDYTGESLLTIKGFTGAGVISEGDQRSLRIVAYNGTAELDTMANVNSYVLPVVIIDSCSCGVYMSSFKLGLATLRGSIQVYGSYAHLRYLYSNASTGFGVSVDHGSRVRTQSVVMSNKAYAATVGSASTFYCHMYDSSLTGEEYGTNNTVGIYCASSVVLKGTAPQGATAEQGVSGGQIIPYTAFTAGTANITSTTDATSTTAGGALTVAGGLAVAKKAYFGNEIIVSSILATRLLGRYASNEKVVIGPRGPGRTIASTERLKINVTVPAACVLMVKLTFLQLSSSHTIEYIEKMWAGRSDGGAWRDIQTETIRRYRIADESVTLEAVSNSVFNLFVIPSATTAANDYWGAELEVFSASNVTTSPNNVIATIEPIP